MTRIYKKERRKEEAKLEKVNMNSQTGNCSGFRKDSLLWLMLVLRFYLFVELMLDPAFKGVISSAFVVWDPTVGFFNALKFSSKPVAPLIQPKPGPKRAHSQERHCCNSLKYLTQCLNWGKIISSHFSPI